MILTRLKGGLGNQMFQYATGLEMATRYNEILKLDATGYDDERHVKSDTPRKYRLFPFAISGEVAPLDEVMKIRNPYGFFSRLVRAFSQKVLRKYHIDYEPDYFNKKRTYVEGFFQSEKNFSTVKDRIRQEFTLKKEYESPAFLDAKKMVAKKNSVSVHIRRGDYANHTLTNSYFGTCSKEYYLKAIAYISSKVENPTFYFFSDDIEWAKKEFGESSTYNYISNPALQDYEELILMSLCSHNILANSSFSWWSAWLNNNPSKIIIAPKKWLNVVPDPQPNIVPETWIRL